MVEHQSNCVFNGWQGREISATLACTPIDMRNHSEDPPLHALKGADKHPFETRDTSLR